MLPLPVAGSANSGGLAAILLLSYDFIELRKNVTAAATIPTPSHDVIPFHKIQEDAMCSRPE